MSPTWQQAVADFTRRRCALVGIGNRLRGDDAFGPMLCDRLRGRIACPVFDAGETPENMVGAVAAARPERVLLLDGVRSGNAPGDIVFFPIEAVPYGGVSTHGASLRMFAEFLTWRAGCEAALLGVEPGSLAMGAPLSDEVRRSLETAADWLERLLQARASACAGD